jgi:hypothetical protein
MPSGARIATNISQMTPPKPTAPRQILCQAVYGRQRIQAVRETLAGMVDKIILDLKSRTYEIHYKLHTGISVASPRGCRADPVCWISYGVAA